MKKHCFTVSFLFIAFIFGLLLVPICRIHSGITSATSGLGVKYDSIGVNDLDDDLDTVQTYDNSDENYNFPNQYFRHLSKHGVNEKGSCAYVAIGMFLSYYDTYWNDNIIPEQYDSQGLILDTEYNGYFYSPGIYDESSDFDDDQSYKSHMMSMINTNFHSYLLSIGDSLGYIGNGTNGSFGLTFDRTYNVLNRYLELHPAADSTNFDYIYVNHQEDYITYSQSMLQDIKEYVKLGQIVIVGIEGTETNTNNRAGHVIIAYDYDEDTDTLYGHFGWDSNYYHTNVLGCVNKYTFSYIKGYITASPYRSSHSHSHNYNYILGGTECSCQLSSHEHRYHYDSATATQHRRFCYCGDSSYQAHIFSQTAGRYVFCEKCNYKKLNDGGIIDIPQPFSTPEILEDIEYVKNMLEDSSSEHFCFE